MNNDILKFQKIYLKILNEQVSPTTFTPEELLNDIKQKCFYSDGEWILYTLKDLNAFCDDKNKPLFSILVKNLQHKYDYAMIIIYFSSIEKLNEICNTYGYFNPHKEYKNFSMKIVYEQLKKYFKNTDKSGCHFNSIDVCPQLGCIIGLNGEKIKSNRDFDKELDHEINHYFEGLNIKYNLISHVKTENLNFEIYNKLNEFYKIDFSKKSSLINDIKYHLFNYKEFRSMSANVFHEILRYNENHFNQLEYHQFITDILNCNYKKYKNLDLQEMIIFCWLCNKLSISRWQILLTGIKSAIQIKKNIFQKFLIIGKDFLRKIFV